MSSKQITSSGPTLIVWSQQLDPADKQAVNSRLLDLWQARTVLTHPIVNGCIQQTGLALMTIIG